MGLKRLAVVSLLLAALAARCGALSVRHSAGEAVLEEASAGKYRLEAASPGPAVTDTGQEPVEVTAALEPPSAGELKDGYEPVPREWLELSSTRLSLRPGETRALSGTVTLPKGVERGLGRYQARWTTLSRAPDGTTLRLSSRLLVRVGEERPPDGSPPGSAEPGEVSVLTRERTAEAVPLGRAVDLSRAEAALKLANLGERPRRARIRAVEADAAPGLAAAGYEPSPNPRFLRARLPVLELPPGAVLEAPLTLEVPDEPRYRGRRWLFAVAVEPEGPGGGATQYFRLLVSTSGEAAR